MERNSSTSGQTPSLVFKPNPAAARGAEIGIGLVGTVMGTCIHYFIINRILDTRPNFILSLALGLGVGAIYCCVAFIKLKTHGSKSLVINSDEVVVEDRRTKNAFSIADVIKAKLANDHSLQWEFYVRHRAEPVILPLKPFLTEEASAIQAALVQRMPCEKQITLQKWEPLN